MSIQSDRLETYNYYHDARTQGPPSEPIIFMDDEDGNEVEVELPTSWAVCPLCEGEGKHVDPAIDAGGLTQEDFDRRPGFRRAYLRGEYDIQCSCCLGRTTVKLINRDSCSEEQLEIYDEMVEEESNFQAMQRAELAMGC